MAEHHFHTYEDGPRWTHGFVQSDGVMPMTQGWAMYRRFNPGAERHEFTDFYGKPRWLTGNGIRIFGRCKELLVMNETDTTMRAMGEYLHLSPSTISRTMTKLAAWGMLAYATSRGKYGGITLLYRAKGDSFERYAIAAREAIQRAYQRAKERFRARLEASGYPKSNVASIYERGTDTRSSSSYVMDATLKREALVERDQALADKLGCTDPRKRVICPVHGTKDRNLSWAWGRNGRLLVKCWSHQCTYDEIRKAVGL